MDKKERQQIEKQAADNYPTGTKFLSVGDSSGKVYQVEGKSKFYWNDHHKDCLTSSDKGCLYLKGKWAKIIQS